MSKNITAKKAKDALQSLRKLTPANPRLDDDLEMTIKEAVFFIAPELVQMAKRGFTIKELSDGLAEEGIKIKPGTLNRYLNEYRVSKEDLEKSRIICGPEEDQPSRKAGTTADAKEENNPNDFDPARQADNSESKSDERQSDPLKKNDESEDASPQSEPSSDHKANESPKNQKSRSENPESTPSDLKPGDKESGEKSDSPPDSQSLPAQVNKE